MKHCIQCGNEYEASPRAPKSYYCSNACKQMNYRDRKALERLSKRMRLEPSFHRFLNNYGINMKADIDRFLSFQNRIGIENMDELMMLMMRFAKIHQNYRPT